MSRSIQYPVGQQVWTTSSFVSGGHGTRTHNRFPGTTFPVWPLAIRLPSGDDHSTVPSFRVATTSSFFSVPKVVRACPPGANTKHTRLGKRCIKTESSYHGTEL
jgi:hypothetical protein